MTIRNRQRGSQGRVVQYRDMGFYDEEGYLWHAGRFKRFTKVGGEMVSLVKVENVLEKYLP